MASASSAACQATSMTHKLRQQWAKKHHLERERASTLDNSQIPQNIPVDPEQAPSSEKAPAKIQLKVNTAESPKPHLGLTQTLMEKFSNLTRIRYGSGDLERMRNPSGESTTSESSEACDLATERRRHLSETTKHCEGLMDSTLVTNQSNS